MLPAVNKTLIIRLSSIGDIILASPLVRILRKKFPAAVIDFLLKSEYAELMRHNPHLSNIIEFDPQAGFKHLRALRRWIRQKRYDLIIDIHGNLRSNFLRRGNSRSVVVKKQRIARFLLINFKWNVYRSTLPVAVRYLETLDSYGIQDDGEGLEIFVPQEISDRVCQQLQKAGLDPVRPTVGMCPTARHPTKMWLPDRFAELALLLLREENANVLLFGGKDDRARCGQIEEQVLEKAEGRGALLNLAGTFSIIETAAVMDLCDVVVTNDSGLLHLAAARKRRVVAIFGPTVKEFGFFPFGTQSTVVERKGLYCRPCSHIGGAKCPESHFRCMKDISVEEVLSEVKSLLACSSDFSRYRHHAIGLVSHL